MSRISQSQLESYLWGAAGHLRGSIDAGDYKQFIFPLLFLKRLCDVHDEETTQALRTSGGDAEFAAFAENHRFQVPAEANWKEIRKETRNVGQAIQRAMRAIESANKDKLFGIFGDAQWTNKDRLSDETMRELVEHFSSLELTITNLPEDELGQGYEFLIKKFADDSGHTAAEFYTNRTVVHLMTEMLDVQPGESVYDPTCGSGGMLMSCVAHLRKQGKEWRNVRLFGQERNLMTSSIARMNCFLHGIEDFRIERGDTLAEPKLVEGDKLMQFDVVLANPPYSIKQWDREAFRSDPWGRNLFGVPPQGRADYAFQQHIIKSLKPKTGRSVALWPHGVLFRKEEDEIRQKLIESDLIEAVIGLGHNLFYNSAMQSCLLVIRTNKPKDRKGKILFIDASQEVTEERAQSFLSKENREKILRAYVNFSSIDGFSAIADLQLIRSQQYSLNIPLYVRTERAVHDEGESQNVALADSFRNWVKNSSDARGTITLLIPDLNRLPQSNLDVKSEIPAWIDRAKWKKVKLGEVCEEISERINDPAAQTSARFVGLEHMDSGELRVRRWGSPERLESAMKLFRAGDVLFARRNAYLKRASRVDFDGICSGDAIVLRENNAIVASGYLALVLNTDKFWSFALANAAGTMSRRVNGKTLANYEFDLPPLDQQRRISEIFWAIADNLESINRLETSQASALAELTSALLTGEGTGASTKESPIGPIPSHWHTGKVRDYMTVIRGASPRPKGDKRYYGGPIPRLMVEDVTRDGKHVTPCIDSLTIEGARLSRPVPAGSLVMVCSGNVGVPAILSVAACIHDGFIGFLDIKEALDKDFVYYQFNVALRLLRKSSTYGGIWSNLTTEILKEFPLVVPPLNEQKSLVQKISEFEALKRPIILQRVTVLDLKNKMLNAVFNK